MTYFQDIEIEGLGSIVRPTTFKLDRPGLNLMKGAVGSGKTTIPSALTWALYGKPLKDKSTVQTWKEIRSSNYKGTKVKVNFKKGDIEYSIIRCQEYKGKIKKLKGNNRIIIIENGELYTGSKNKKDQQEFINNIIGYSFDLFKSSIIFGQKMKRIIEESGPDKKKIFEEGFNINFIEEAKQKVKSQLDDLLSSKSHIGDTIDNNVEKIEELKDFLKDTLAVEKNFKKDKENRIKELRDEIAEIEKDKEKLLNTKGPDKSLIKIKKRKLGILETKLDNIQNKIRDLNNLKRTVDDLKDKANDKKVELNDNSKKICTKCGQPLNKKRLQITNSKLRAEFKNFKKQIRNYETKIDKIKIGDKDKLVTKVNKLKGKVLKLEHIASANKLLLAMLPKHDKKIRKLNKKIKSLEKKKLVKKSIHYKDKIVKLESQLKANKRSLRRIVKQIEIKQWLIKDPLSNSGLKAYMFNHLLSSVNNKLQEYSRVLGFLVEFGIDLESNHKDFYQYILKDDIVINYADLSGGQKQLVDTSVALAIHDVISDLRPSNIMFLDEPFESLDTEHIEIIEELIENKAKDRSVYIITHLPNFRPINCNTIGFKLNSKKFTKIL